MGLLDFMNTGQTSPTTQGLLALSQALLQAGQPSRVPVNTAQAFGPALISGSNAYRAGSERAAIANALQGGDIKGALNTMMTSPDPEFQKPAMQAAISMMIPQWDVTKDAMGNPVAYNKLDPSQTKPVGNNPLFGAPGAQGAGGNVSNGQTLTGDAYLQTLPQNIADQVKALAEGRMQFPGGFALKSPYWQQMISAVSQYDPSFDAVNYNARASTRKDFTSGKSAQNVTAINTAMGHLNSLKDSADALNNSSVPLWNTVANAAESAVGDPRLKSFNLNKDAVADELTRVFRQSGGSAADIADWKAQLDSSGSPEQFKGVMQKGIDLLNSRLDSIAQQYNTGMGTTKQGVDLLSPKAQAAYQRLTGEASPLTNAAQGAQQPKAQKATLPPAGAIAMLKANPALAPMFEQKYGISAATFLGGPGAGQ